jgi:hypothetical protein
MQETLDAKNCKYAKKITVFIQAGPPYCAVGVMKPVNGSVHDYSALKGSIESWKNLTRLGSPPDNEHGWNILGDSPYVNSKETHPDVTITAML